MREGKQGGKGSDSWEKKVIGSRGRERDVVGSRWEKKAAGSRGCEKWVAEGVRRREQQAGKGSSW